MEWINYDSNPYSTVSKIVVYCFYNFQSVVFIVLPVAELSKTGVSSTNVCSLSSTSNNLILDLSIPTTTRLRYVGSL